MQQSADKPVGDTERQGDFGEGRCYLGNITVDDFLLL